jgi:NDP-sugar pyrophosphorylase family protein
LIDLTLDLSFKEREILNMKALILAAGLGTRLKPLTNGIPKVMIDVGGKPLLWYQVMLLKHHGIDDIWINLYWFPEAIMSYFGDGSGLGVKIKYSMEEGELLGTAGALKNNKSGVREAFEGTRFLITYGDNLTDFDHGRLLEFHKGKEALMSLGLYRHNRPWEKGCVETDRTGQVVGMVEKPPKGEEKTDQANTGIYVCEPKVLEYIPEGFSDFGAEIIPAILEAGEELYALETDAYVEDVGTFAGLEKAQRDIERGRVKFPFQ